MHTPVWPPTFQGPSGRSPRIGVVVPPVMYHYVWCMFHHFLCIRWLIRGPCWYTVIHGWYTLLFWGRDTRIRSWYAADTPSCISYVSHTYQIRIKCVSSVYQRTSVGPVSIEYRLCIISVSGVYQSSGVGHVSNVYHVCIMCVSCTYHVCIMCVSRCVSLCVSGVYHMCIIYVSYVYHTCIRCVTLLGTIDVY